MERKAQFFLIAGLIIATVILGLGQVYTSSITQKHEGVVYQLSDEIYYETSQVIDNGVFNDRPQTEINQDIQDLTQHYAELNPDSDIVIVYGDGQDLQQISYTGNLDNLTESSINTTTVDIGQEEQEITVTLASDKEIKDTRTFPIKEGQNFYLVVRKKIKNEEYVVAQ